MTAIKINTFEIDWLEKFSLNNSDHEEVLILINLITIQLSPKNLSKPIRKTKAYGNIFLHKNTDHLCIDKSCFNKFKSSSIHLPQNI